MSSKIYFQLLLKFYCVLILLVLRCLLKKLHMFLESNGKTSQSPSFSKIEIVLLDIND